MATIIRPCPNSFDCPGFDSPLANYSSEAPDPPDFIADETWGDATGPGVGPPPLNTVWTATACGKTFTSTVSQLDADLLALAAAILCLHQDPVPGPFVGPSGSGNSVRTIFFNTTVTCSVPCPGQGLFTYTLPGGLIAGWTQAEADQHAFAIACRQAKLRRFCISNLSPLQACVNEPYNSVITATGYGLAGSVWTISDGELPPGLTLIGFDTSGVITGTPDTAGTYTFTVQILELDGSHSFRQYSMCVIEITPATLPDATNGTAYSQTLTASTCAPTPLSWQVTSGSLPSGLFLNETTGVISGTPTTVGVYSFTISLQTQST